MRIEAGDRLQGIQRGVEPIGERAQLAFRQEAVGSLNGAKLVEYGRVRPRPIHANSVIARCTRTRHPQV
jgi:hypothetical protein